MVVVHIRIQHIFTLYTGTFYLSSNCNAMFAFHTLAVQLPLKKYN